MVRIITAFLNTKLNANDISLNLKKKKIFSRKKSKRLNRMILSFVSQKQVKYWQFHLVKSTFTHSIPF